MRSKEEIAKSAANEWCRCFKCEGIVHDKEPYYKCEQPGATCWKWYDGYRTAMIAFDMLEREKEKDKEYKKAKEDYDYYTIYPEDIPDGKSILDYMDALKKFE